MSTETIEDRIEAAIKSIGGSAPKIFEVEAAGIVGVRFRNCIDLMETRFGMSLADLERRCTKYATNMQKRANT